MNNTKTNDKNPCTAFSIKPAKAIYPRKADESFYGKIKSDRDLRVGANKICKN